MNIRIADDSDKKDLENFLVSDNGEEHKNLAENYLNWASLIISGLSGFLSHWKMTQHIGEQRA